MKNGCDRISSIVRGLRTFSRLDEAEKKSIDIHASIDSTIMLLHNRLRDARSCSIEVVKDYGNLPLVTCYAFKVLDRFTTQVLISDNCEGMNRDTLAKIFDPFFTTKPVGKGTELGMAIAYQIIVAERRSARQVSAKRDVADAERQEMEAI